MNQEANKFLGEAPIGKLMLKFSVPCIMSLLIAALYNMVDQIFIGHGIGYLGNGATNIVFPVTVIALAIAIMIGDGCAAYLSLCQGRKDTDGSHKSVGNALIMIVGFSIVITVLYIIFSEQILWGFGATENNIEYAREYFQFIIIGIPFYLFGNAMSAVIRADGSPGYAMIATLVGCLLNIILDPIAIFVLDWGMMGAAIATVFGQIVTAIMCFAYLFRTKTFKLKVVSFKPQAKMFKHILPLGISSFLTQISIVILMAVMNNVLVRYGAMSKYGADIPLTILGIVMKVFSIVVAFCIGTAVGAQPIVGYNYGAGNIARVKETFKKMIVAEICIGLVAFALFECFPLQIISIFGGVSDPLYKEFAVLTMRIYLVGITLCCVQKGCSVFLQALGKPVLSATLTLLREIVLNIPFVILLPIALGVEGALYSAPIADAGSLIITILIMYSVIKKMKVLPATDTNVEICDSHPGVIITIAREHGSAGKRIGQLVAEKLGVSCYYKEVAAIAAKESGLAKEFISELNQNSPTILRELYLSTEVVKDAVIAQEKVINMIADKGSCVIVGRAADHILRSRPNVVRIFIHAPIEQRIKNVMEMYGDTEEEARRNIKRSDAARAAYYQNISRREWGNSKNYDLTISSEGGLEATVNHICDFVTAEIKE